MDGKGTNVSVGPRVLVILGVNVVVILGVVVVVPDLTAVVDTVGSTVPCTVPEGVGVPVAAPAGSVAVGVSDCAGVAVVVAVVVGEVVAIWALIECMRAIEISVKLGLMPKVENSGKSIKSKTSDRTNWEFPGIMRV